MEVYEHTTSLPCSAATVFGWLETSAAYYRYLPPWEPIETLERAGTVRDGDRVKFRIPVGPFKIGITLEHEEYDFPREFGNRQIAGPDRYWRHRHIVHSTGESSCELTDLIHSTPGRLAGLVGRERMRARLEYILEFTHEQLRRDLIRHDCGSAEPRRVLISGASGLVGGALRQFLEVAGHEVVGLVGRAETGSAEIYWDPGARKIDAEALEGFDAVFHLAGENVASGRWTALRRQRMRESHVAATEFLCNALSRLQKPPAVVVSASDVAFYGDESGGVEESAPVGSGFLAALTKAREQATAPAGDAGIRVVHARLGRVLSSKGGLLRRLLPAFRFGAGAVAGSGRQPISWIGMDDAIGALHFLMRSDEARGPINLVSPETATNREFARTLAAVLRRRTFVSVPGIAIRARFGEMGDEFILKGQAAAPARLEELGFRWWAPALEAALRWELGAGRKGELAAD